jgi:hypothetical protein
MTFQSFPKPSHSRKVKKKGDRGKFSKMVRDEIKKHFDDTCQECGGKGLHIHHVCFRSQSGRGVFSNGLLLCNNCHKRIHLDNDRALYWREVFKKQYGPLYYMDKEDLEYKQLTQELQKEDKEVKEWVEHNGKFQY